MLFGRANREQDYLTHGHCIVHLGPCKIGVQILLGGRHTISSSWCLQQWHSFRAFLDCTHTGMELLEFLEPTTQKVDRLLVDRKGNGDDWLGKG